MRPASASLERTQARGSRYLSLAEFEDDFAVAFALAGVCDCSLGVLQGISFVDFRLQQPALRHFKQWSERFHTFVVSRVVVPFIDPDAAETQVLKYQKACWNF